MNFKTLTLASLFMLAAGTIAVAMEEGMTNVIQDVNYDEAGRDYGTKQGAGYHFKHPDYEYRYYKSKWWENEETAPACGGCNRCNACAPACPTC